MLDAAPRKVNFQGKDWDYKRVVIYITDGVSNIFLNKSDSKLYGGLSEKGTYSKNHPSCYVDKVYELAECQVTGDGVRGGGLTEKYGSIPKGWDRPITMAGQVSKNDLQANGAEVYVIALSNIPATGLQDSIASFPKYYFSAASLERDAQGKTNVDAIMEVINTLVESRSRVCLAPMCSTASPSSRTPSCRASTRPSLAAPPYPSGRRGAADECRERYRHQDPDHGGLGGSHHLRQA
jgi:hypothetical protein